MSKRITSPKTHSGEEKSPEYISTSPKNRAIIRQDLAEYGKEFESVVERGLVPAYILDMIMAAAGVE